MKAFTIGAAIYIIAVSLFAGSFYLALDHYAAKQAKCAHDLMLQLKPGITECYHSYDCTFNCQRRHKGQRRLTVLSAQRSAR